MIFYTATGEVKTLKSNQCSGKKQIIEGMANHEDEHVFTVNDKEEIKKHMEECQFSIDQINPYDMVQEDHTLTQIKETMIANGVSQDDERIVCLENKLSKMHHKDADNSMPEDSDDDNNMPEDSDDDNSMIEEEKKKKRRVVKGNLKVNGHIKINEDKKVCIGDTCLSKEQLEELLRLVE